MKYVKEIVIIFGITMVGELLNKFIPLPVPAGVYGLFILLGGLRSGIIKLSDVEVTGNLLLDLMPVMFIPAAVGIIDKIEELKAVMIPMLIITFVRIPDRYGIKEEIRLAGVKSAACGDHSRNRVFKGHGDHLHGL